MRLAHSFAIENDWIKADCIEATEFPDAVAQHRVYAVPKTVINGSSYIEGALPEEFFLDSLLKELGVDSEKDSRDLPT